MGRSMETLRVINVTIEMSKEIVWQQKFNIKNCDIKKQEWLSDPVE